MPAVREAPSYSSMRVQRASRINSIESARLLQQLQCIERAKQHQCRLTNQDIRLVSLSMDYIQSSSGNSPEAWRPSDDVGPSDVPEENKSEGPCFLYGERIISRKMRRVQRPMSAVERTVSGCADDSSETSDVTSISTRPKSSPGKHRRRPSTATSWARWQEYDEKETAAMNTDSGITSESHHHPAAECDSLNNSIVSTPRSQPREAWEDDTSPATKKILKAQARAQAGKRNSLYVSPSEVMTAQTSRNVRHLARMIRVTSSPMMEENLKLSPRPVLSPSQNIADKPPKRPTGAGRDSLGRRATLGEILNQHKPTLNAKAWKDHLHKAGATPISISSQRQAMLEAKKQMNDSHREEVDKKVQNFVNSSPRWRRKSIFR